MHTLPLPYSPSLSLLPYTPLAQVCTPLQVYSCPPVDEWMDGLGATSGKRYGYHPLLHSFSPPVPGRRLCCTKATGSQGAEGVRGSRPGLSKTHTGTHSHLLKHCQPLLVLSHGRGCLQVPGSLGLLSGRNPREEGKGWRGPGARINIHRGSSA